MAFSSLTSWAESYPPFSAMMEGSCLERMDYNKIMRAFETDSKSHLRAFAKLVMALASLPGVTLDSSSTALTMKDSTEVTVSRKDSTDVTVSMKGSKEVTVSSKDSTEVSHNER